jgi:hypothetical protein
MDWYVTKKRKTEHTARDSLQCINQGRGMRNYFTRNEKRILKYFPRNKMKRNIKGWNKTDI